MTPLRPDLLALVFAAVSTAAVAWADVAAQPDATLSEARARDEAATYLASRPRHARLHGQPLAEQWEVSDGHDTAWIDAQTGQLIEIEFAAR